MKKVLVIDYGSGNILSVKRAFEYCGANILISNDINEIKNADYLVLPGVGAFKDGMSKLIKHNLVNTIRDYCAQNRPFMGICLGMQLLMDVGFEYGECKGLGVVKGKVVRINSLDSNGVFLKTPNIGWRNICIPNSCNWDNSVLASIRSKESVFYFVHSFVCLPDDNKEVLAESYYGINSFCAALRKGNTYGFQFHPEKSRDAGLSIITEWMKI